MQLDAFLSLSDRHVVLSMSSFDPGLSEASVCEESPDVQILWSDWRLQRPQLTPSDSAEWLKQRVESIRSSAADSRVILVNDWPLRPGADPAELSWAQSLGAALRSCVEQLADVYLIPIAELALPLGESFWDDRNAEAGGFPFSAAASTSVARMVGSVLIPGALAPRLKAIVLDLDDTLYSGVLGEDGPDGVRLTDGHRALQAELVELAQSGVLLVLCSRNEHLDAEQLWARRPDFPLRWDHFTATRISWEPKAVGIAELADELSIHSSAMVFVDDNPSELARAKAAHPDLSLIQACEDGHRSVEVLRSFPRLSALRRDEISGLRSADVRANIERRKRRAALPTQQDYLASLKMQVDLFSAHRPHIGRVHELSGKTNQFNLGLGRLSRTQVEEAFGPGWQATTVALRDALTDSGVIGAFLCEIHGQEALLAETVFSCRALGRDIESLALRHVVRRLGQAGVESLAVRTTVGPRNAPAITWADDLGLTAGTSVGIPALLARLDSRCAAHPATLELHP